MVAVCFYRTHCCVTGANAQPKVLKWVAEVHLDAPVSELCTADKHFDFCFEFEVSLTSLIEESRNEMIVIFKAQIPFYPKSFFVT